MSNWAPRTLGDVVDVLDSQRRPVNSDDRSNRPGDVPYYGANGQQGWIDKPLFNDPLILLAEDGGNFDDFAWRPIAYRIEGPSWVNNHAHIIRARKGHSQSFLFWSLVHRDIRRFISGGTRTKLTQSEMRAIEIDTPSFPEQVRIAEILDTLENQIQSTKRIITKLNTVRLSILEKSYQSLLTDSSMTSLNDLTVCIVDGVHHTPTYTKDGVPFLTIENLTRGSGISLTPCRFVSEKAHSIYRKRIEPRPGDVLVSKDGTLGVARIVPKAFPPASVFVSVAVLRPRTDVLLTEFLRLFFDTNDFKRQLGGLSAGSGLKHIHLEHFRKFQIPVVSIPDQSKLVSAVAHCDELITREESCFTKLMRIKHGLASDLLTGRIRVNAGQKQR